VAWVAGEARLVAFDGADWVAAGTDVSGAATFGINASADDINRLAVAAPATLLNHEGAGHQLKINKLAPGDTASLLFQTDFSGRAEMGTAGDDDFRFKVSPDGAQWFEAIAIDRATGAVSLPRTPLRAQLTAPRTYHVRADGDDGNDGLAGTAGRAFATIQKAIDTAATLDLSVHDVTIRVGPGTYAPFAMKSCVGAGQVVIVGDEDMPADVAVASTASSLPLAWASSPSSRRARPTCSSATARSGRWPRQPAAAISARSSAERWRRKETGRSRAARCSTYAGSWAAICG
jgi:pectin methylesterase-like acyl-CoA thioesterase